MSITPAQQRHYERRLKRAAESLSIKKTLRDGLIREALEAGMSTRQVGDAVGLSHVQVLRIRDTEVDQ